MNNLEIERKFLIDINDIPYDINSLDKKEIEQGYILYNPEIRVRAVSDKNYYMTIKSNTNDNLVRNEIEFEISKEAYKKLIEREDINKISKSRYSIIENNNKYEIDVFSGRHKGLACLEVEFNSVEAAKDFLVPSWVKKEVTDDVRYKSGFLSKNNIPLE